MMELFQHSLFVGHNHPSRLVEEIQWRQLGSSVEQGIDLASDVLAVAHNLAASAVLAVARNLAASAGLVAGRNSLELGLVAFVVLVVGHNTGKVGFAASAAVESKNSVLVARNRLVFASPERHRFESPYSANWH